MRLLLIIMIVLSFWESSSAYDIDGGRRVGMAGTVLLSSPSISGLLACPVAKIEKEQFILESGFYRKYELSDLDRVFILSGYRYKNITGTIGFSQLGKSDYYTEQIYKATISYYIDSFAVSVFSSGKVIEIGRGFGKFRAASIGLAGGFHYRAYHLAVLADNMNKPEIAANLEGDEPIYTVFAEIAGNQYHSLTGKFTFEKYQKPRASIGQYIRIIDNNAIYWGVSHNPLTYGGGIELEYSKMSFVYALSYHPALGFSHNISFAFLSGGKRNQAE